MQVLTGQFPVLLTPTSQEGGNMIQPDLGESAMTAPGSTPVSPLPGPSEGSDPEIDFSGPEVPVSNAPHRPVPRAGRDGAGNWGDIDKYPSGTSWKGM
jgi:hypothetical protein